MRRFHRLLRKAKILLAHFRVRSVIAERHSDGTPRLIIRYRGAEKYLREVSRKEK